MKEIWEKGPGRWKVSGESKVFSTKEAALEWAATLFEVVKIVTETEEELTAEEEIDPLEALKQVRINNGSIEEGSDYYGDHEDEPLSEGSY